MFFNSVEEILGLARQNGTSIFVVPREAKIKIPGALVLQPEARMAISIDQVRAIQENVSKRQIGEMLVVVRPAERMSDEAENAFLKTLEQPGEKVHFLLITDRPTALLPTILSRAAIYYLRAKEDFLAPVAGSEKEKKLARSLLTARGSALVDVVKTVAKGKTGEVQRQALDILGVAIEMAYKSFFATGKTAFLTKLEGLIEAYERISSGGNIKLQIAAGLL